MIINSYSFKVFKQHDYPVGLVQLKDKKRDNFNGNFMFPKYIANGITKTDTLAKLHFFSPDLVLISKEFCYSKYDYDMFKHKVLRTIE